ncbi:ABC transporter permease [Budvicia diplopodorum]|uniref:ABC transporter permease n=1 Tax=Budvicia diplopodorum TaxID=1119056 RepID=UPI001359F61B|nr:FtsX-like permease family protein [Budvicia diplopodorum]
MIPLKIIYADFRRLWGGAVVLVLLIAAAVAFSMVINLQERALREGSARAADRFDLIIGAAGSETQLVLSTVFLQPSALPLLSGKYLTALKRHPLVERAAPIALGDSYMGMPVIGVDNHLIGQQAVTGSGVFNRRQDAIVGASTGLSIGDKVVPVHGQIGMEGAHQHEHASYTVTGILSATNDAWDKAILVPIEAVWELHHQEAQGENMPGVSAVVVKPKTIAGAYQLRSQYRGGETQAVFPAEILTRLYSTLGDARQVISSIAIGAQILVVIAMLLVVVIHLEQRKRQLGALRAFGAPRRGIVGLVWIGLMSMVTSGIILGVGTGYLAALWISSRVSMLYGMKLPVTLTGSDGLFILSLWCILGLILLIPALTTYRYSPAQALRAQN